ncbi:hypothetical protein ACOJBO_10045 [Rhizobium beringeri]
MLRKSPHTGETFKRIFFREEDCDELYPSIIRNVVQRYDTPFFFALRDHAKLPVSNFHALPVSRGKSIRHSNWIGDFEQFYGTGLFSAESSATSGGLDSPAQSARPT